MIPGTRSSSPAGNAGAGSVAAGRSTFSGRVRYDVIQRPAPPMAAAAAASAPAASSTPRRLAPPGESPGRALTEAERTSQASAATPVTAAARLGRRSAAPAVGRVSAAPAAIATRTTSRPAPRANRRRASRPATAASSSTPASTDPTRTVLSLVPKWAMAHSLSGVGVRSMTVEPTASTGEAAGSVSAATRCPAATPTMVASTPNPAWSSRVVMTVVRSGGGSGWRCGRMWAMSDAPAELVHYGAADAVATLTLDSQHNRNALSRQLVTELFAGLERAAADDDVRVVLIRAEGRVFCSGADLSEATAGGMEEGARRIVELQRLIVSMDKPVVTRLHGAVRAGGIGIVAASDIAVAAEDATFALTEVKLGLAAAIISLTVHHRMSPRASSLTTLGGEVFTGRDAAAYGLVTTAVPADGLDAEVDRICASLATGAPQGLRESKRILNRDLIARIDALGEEMAELSARLFASDAAREAMTAFLSRKK